MRVLPPSEQSPHSPPVCLLPLEVAGNRSCSPLAHTAPPLTRVQEGSPGSAGSPGGWGLGPDPEARAVGWGVEGRVRPERPGGSALVLFRLWAPLPTLGLAPWPPCPSFDTKGQWQARLWAR